MFLYSNFRKYRICVTHQSKAKSMDNQTQHSVDRLLIAEFLIQTDWAGI